MNSQFLQSLALTKSKRLHNNNNNNNNNNNHENSLEGEENEEEEEANDEEVEDDSKGGDETKHREKGNQKQHRKRPLKSGKKYCAMTNADDSEDNTNDDDYCKAFIKQVIKARREPKHKDDDVIMDGLGSKTTNSNNEQRRLRNNIPRQRIKRWSNYMTLQDKPMKYKSFLLSDSKFAPETNTTTTTTTTEMTKNNDNRPSHLLDKKGGRVQTRFMRSKLQDKEVEDDDEEGEGPTTSADKLRRSRRQKRRKLEKEGDEQEEEEEEIEDDEEEERRKARSNDDDDDDDEGRRVTGEEEREGEEKGAPGAINKGTTDKDEKRNTAPVREEDNEERQKIKSDEHANLIRDAVKKRINYERERERQKDSNKPNANTQRQDNIIFPPLSILLVDDYMLVNSSNSTGNQDYHEDINATFRRDVTATYKTLSNIFSSLSNHLQIHVIALGKKSREYMKPIVNPAVVISRKSAGNRPANQPTNQPTRINRIGLAST